MTSSEGTRVITALAIAVVIFAVAVVLPKLLVSGAIPSLALTQGLELTLSLLAIAIFGKGKFADYGFRRINRANAAASESVSWLKIGLCAPIFGIVTSIAILGLGGNGNPVVKQLSLPQIVLFVWISSSTIEEVFTRGFLQGHLSAVSHKSVPLPYFRIQLPALISALFFASMHLVLPLSGADAITTVTIVLFTLSVGLMAGHLRAKTGSLIPAIMVHILANVGGMIGGVIFVIYRVVTGGELPTM